MSTEQQQQHSGTVAAGRWAGVSDTIGRIVWWPVGTLEQWRAFPWWRRVLEMVIYVFGRAVGAGVAAAAGLIVLGLIAALMVSMLRDLGWISFGIVACGGAR